MDCDLRNRAPRVERLPDYRQRVTREYDVLNNLPKSPADILASCWLQWGTADDDYTGALLIKQDISGQETDFPDSSKRPPVLTRVFEEMSPTGETQVGNAAIEYDQYDNKIVTIESIQLSAGTAIYQVPGITSAPAPNNDAVLKDEQRTDDGTLMRIKRIYTTGGQMSDVIETKYQGKLVIRTLKYLNQVPPTPSGYTLITQNVEFVRGMMEYTYTFAYGYGLIVDVHTRKNDDQVVVYNRVSLGVAPDEPAPTTGGTLALLTDDIRQADGYTIYDYTWVEGLGEISRKTEYLEGGSAGGGATGITRITIQRAAGPRSDQPAWSGVTGFTQISADGDERDAYKVWTAVFAKGIGEVSRAFTNSQGGAVAFDPANPTASIGPVICTIKYLSLSTVTADPTTPPPNFVRVSVDHEEAEGYRAWSVRFAYGFGTVLQDEEYRNQGKLTLFHRVALGAPPTAPTATTSGQLTDIVVTNPGSGYTSAPTVAITGGGGTGATAVAVLNGTSVASVALTNAGSGYTSAPIVAINGGGGGGATATATLTGTTIASIAIVSGGSGYTSAPTVAFTGGAGTGAAATAGISSGVLSAALTNSGSGYTSPPTVTFSSGGGSGAAATATLTATTIASASLTNAGSGYTSPPAVTVAGGGGSNGAITAALSPTTIASLALTSAGNNYTSAPTVAFTGGAGSGAAATATLAGTGISGLKLTNQGSGYFADFHVTMSGGGGSGADFIAKVDPGGSGKVIGFTRWIDGAGYTSTPTVDMSAGGGTGATAVAVRLGGLQGTGGGSGGTGYTSQATAVFTGGDGSGAVGVGFLDGIGGVFLVLSDCGTGYTTVPTLSYTGGGGSGATGQGLKTIAGAAIGSITLTNQGSGYTSLPAISFSGGGGSGATATATLTAVPIGSLTVSNAGSGYTSVPTLSFSGGGGSGGAGNVTLTGTTIASVSVTNQGSGYTSAPTIGFTGGSGSGGAATANLAPSTVSSLTLTNAGSGYTSAPTISFSGGGGANASATATLTATTIASLTLTAAGSGYTSTPTLAFSGGAGTGAAGTATLAASTVGSVSVTNPGSVYTSLPTIGFSGGGGTGAAATAEVAFSTGEVNLISAKFRHEDGYDVYDYTWAEGIGVIEERIQAREGGLRMETWTSFGYSAGTSVFTPAGIPMMIDEELLDGVTKWVVTCMQNSAGGDPTSGTALTFGDYEDFTYPGRAKLYYETFSLWASGTGYVYNLFQSPPIQIKVLATIAITYTTSNTIGSLTYPLWNPDEWASVRWHYQGLDAYARSDSRSLFGFMSVGTAVMTFSAPAYPSSLSVMDTNILQNSSGAIQLTGGPSDPAGTTVTLLAKLEPAFVSFAGVQYYRKTIVTATIPAQPALPV